MDKTVQLYLNYDLTASGLMVTDAQPAPKQDDMSEVEDFIDEVIDETLEETLEDIQPST